MTCVIKSERMSPLTEIEEGHKYHEFVVTDI